MEGIEARADGLCLSLTWCVDEIAPREERFGDLDRSIGGVSSSGTDSVCGGDC